MDGFVYFQKVSAPADKINDGKSSWFMSLGLAGQLFGRVLQGFP
jgi:hypothetical protein